MVIEYYHPHPGYSELTLHQIKPECTENAKGCVCMLGSSPAVVDLASEI